MTSIFQLTLQYTCFGQRCINTWNYYHFDATPPVTGLAYALVDAFGGIPVGGVYPVTKLVHQISITVQAAVNFDQIICKDLYNPLDFYETPFTTALAGTGVGETLSPAMALGFRTTRVRSDIKRGTKRFVGVGEASVGTGGVFGAPFLSGVATDLGNEMSASITGNTPAAAPETFQPCIVKKERYLPPGNVAPNYAYRYYEDKVTALANIAIGIVWSPYDQVRTQVSRQYGRGQ